MMVLLNESIKIGSPGVDPPGELFGVGDPCNGCELRLFCSDMCGHLLD